MAGRHDEEEDYMRDIDTLSQDDVEVRLRACLATSVCV